MEEDPPPLRPPDPGPGETQMDDPPHTPTPSQARKRPRNGDSKSQVPSKKLPTDTTPSVQTVYTHPSFAEGAKGYEKDDKRSFIVHVSREVADPSAAVTIRALKFGQFLHANKFSGITSGGVKSVGGNKIIVEFITTEAAYDFIIGVKV